MTNLERGDATLEQVALLYAQRADTENVFDELKNQWGFSGLLQREGGGDGAGRPVGAADLQPVEPVHAADGLEPGASHRSDQVAAELFIPGGAGGPKRAVN